MKTGILVVWDEGYGKGDRRIEREREKEGGMSQREREKGDIFPVTRAV